MEPLPVSEMKILISSVVKEVAYHKNRIIITRHGQRMMACVPIEDFELLEGLKQKEGVRKTKSLRR